MRCLLFALLKCYEEGGYLVMRRNKVIFFLPHFLHMDKQLRYLTHKTYCKDCGWYIQTIRLRRSYAANTRLNSSNNNGNT